MVSFRSDPLNLRRFRLISEGSALSTMVPLILGSSVQSQLISFHFSSIYFRTVLSDVRWFRPIFMFPVSDFKGVSSGTG